MIGKILQLRLRQFFRLMKGIGIFRLVFLLLLIAFVMFIAMRMLAEPGYPIVLVVVIAISLLSIQTGRKDKHFIQLIYNRPYFVFLAEYFIMLLPFTGIALWVHNYYAAGALFVLCLLVPFFRIQVDMNGGLVLFSILLNPIRLSQHIKVRFSLPLKDPLAFEWMSGLRSGFILLLPLYLVVLAFSFRAIVAPIGILLISLVITGFYYQGESREFIELFASCPSGFLKRKTGVAVKYLTALLIPIMLVALFFQPETWYWILGSWIASCFFQLITIIFKYALFRENDDLSSNGMIVIFNILCILLPFFWPVSLIMGTRYYFKALQNLKPYFDDCHS